MRPSRFFLLLMFNSTAISPFSLFQMRATLAREIVDRAENSNLPQHSLSASCAVTLPSQASFGPPTASKGPLANIPPAADQFWVGSEKLWTILPVDGTWRGQTPREPHQFVYSNKMPWFRFHPAFSPKDGPLTITGKRLDGAAPRFTATYLSNGFRRDDDNAMIMGGMEIPTFGCWEITGHYKDQTLSFIVWVTSLPEEASPSDISMPAQESVAQSTKATRILLRADIAEQQLVYQVELEIPAGLSGPDATGTVVLHAVIGTDGKARDLRFVSGPAALADAAIDAASWRRYRVTLLDNQAVEVITTISVAFPSKTN
jgi:hypothetical protein